MTGQGRKWGAIQRQETMRFRQRKKQLKKYDMKVTEDTKEESGSESSRINR
jgi:hypothetical protein